jgi:hypothetical protein
MSQVKVDGYIEIPRHKWYQIEDIFTRIDEELEVLIKQIDYSNRLLENAVSLLNSIASSIQQIVPPAPAPPTPIPPPPTPPPPQAPGKVISLPFKVIPTDTKSYTAPEGTATEIPLTGDAFILVADSDIYIGIRQDVQSFLLTAGVYLVMYRAPELEKIYVRSSTGTANIYLMYLQVVS